MAGSDGEAQMEEQVSISRIQVGHQPIRSLDRRAEAPGHGGACSVCIGVPWWTMMTAGAAPAPLVVGFLVAAMLQPVSYDSLRDTISALAARGAVDPWVMTAAISAVGACYLVTALGLSPARGSAGLRSPAEASRPSRLQSFRRRFTATRGRTPLP